MRLRENRTVLLTYDLYWVLLDGPRARRTPNRHFSFPWLRDAWQEHGDELLGEYDGQPGDRPWGFWRFTAGREEHLTDDPVVADADFKFDEEGGRAADAWEFEPILWLARCKHLRADEIEQLRAEATTTAPRIGTDGERMQNEAISNDRSAVRLAVAVDAALAGKRPPPDYGVPYTGTPQITYERPKK